MSELKNRLAMLADKMDRKRYSTSEEVDFVIIGSGATGGAGRDDRFGFFYLAVDNVFIHVDVDGAGTTRRGNSESG